MIYELAKNDYEKVRSIFTELQAYNLIIAAVIEGTSPGRIYVDDVSKPKTAFMCSVEGYYLAGYEGNATFNSGLRKLIAETIFVGDTVREGDWELDLRFLPGTWEARLEAILEGLDRPPIKFDRRHYVCRESKVDWKAQIPAGFSIQRVDEKLLTRPELTMPDHLINWMKINWGSIEDFMQKGFGFCTLHGEKVVCWCMADCVSGDACEVGIRTHPDYRRRGLATLTVAATVDYCLTHGFASVGWHCDKDNLGSVGVAEKVGFEKERDYVGHSCMFDKETNNINYNIRPYTPTDTAGLAVMWNESDDQWPGTFTQGVPFTEERVREWMEKETALMRLVVEGETDGRIVGFGSLWEDQGQEDTCCVDLLNVHPAHQKRSLARRMLTQMVDWATDNGYHRMTIGTWPGNLKSVPLYKKVGFFWIPDTSAYMENYVPHIRQLAIAQRFFERHDWYTTFRRELEQVEDDQRHPATGDMKVYIYRWEENGEFLEAVVDRQAQAITGLETEHFAAYAVVDESEPAQGIAYPVHWRIANKRAGPVNVSLLAGGETGIELDYCASFTLAAGEERIVEATFTCAVDAPRLDPREPREEEKPAPKPKIETTLVVGSGPSTVLRPGPWSLGSGQALVVELGTGLRYHPAVEIGAEPEIPSLLPGRPQTIHLQLRNRVDGAVSGAVTIAPQEGLTTGWLRHEFEVEAGSYAGLPLTITCHQAGAIPLLVAATFANGDCQVTTKPQRIPLLVTPLGGISADINKDKLVIENDLFQLVCRAKGGRCLLRSKALQRREGRILEEIGPPFDPWDLFEKQYDLALEHGQGWARAILTAKSGHLPGLTLMREMTVTASPLLQVRYRVVNNGAMAHKFQVKPSLRLSDQDAAQIALPRKERLVIERASEFPSAHGDFPRKPEGMAEQWVALSRAGQVAGAIWDKDVVEHEFDWGCLHLYFAERALEPQGAVNVGPFYLYVGPGDWRDVRRAWQRIAGTAARRPEPLPEPARSHAFGLSPVPLVTLTGQVETRLCTDSVREREMKGRIIVEPPPGWQVDGAEFSLEGLAREKPLEETLHLAAPDTKIGAVAGQLHLETTQFDEVRPFTVIRLGDEKASVRVEEGQEADQSLWVIANGRCAWTLAPAFHGGAIAWREAGSEINHLMTAFPDDGALGWLKPWFGGIRPILVPAGDDERGWPGKLHEETFVAAPFEAADARGLPWRGVQLVASLKREGFEGLRAEIAYLTLGGSNVLKVVYRLVNETSAYRRAVPGLFAFLQVDGRHENSVLHGDGLQRKRTPQMSWPLVGDWGAVVNPSSGRAVVMAGASGKKHITLMDWGVDGGYLFFDNRVTLAAHDSHELVAYLALTGSLDEARRYRSLSSL